VTPSAVEPSTPLRVLMVMHVPAQMELGAARVQLELAEVLQAHGCEVQVLDRGAILGSRERGRLGASPRAFAAAAVRRVRSIARDYDVIDAHQGDLPTSKSRLGFEGLMVTRSVGLAPLYAEFVRDSQRRWPETTKAHPLTRPARRWRKWHSLRQVMATLRSCDLLIVPNDDERAYLDDRMGLGGKTVVLPLGISQQRLLSLRTDAAHRAATGARVCFIGAWTARKGSRDWPEILAGVRRRMPETAFLFLGTHVAAPDVTAEMGLPPGDIEVVASYRSEQLPDLLGDVRVGALPSYIEGLGLGVLEKMAAGIPSVCYDVPGPRATMGAVDRRFLVPAGDTDAFAQRLVELLALDRESYEQLSERCREVAETFSWEKIGAGTLSAYHRSLEMLGDYTPIDDRVG
jgi:glycosyltransferase involved in cell wall biosynthesis